jgi:hypothetical protein
VADNEGKPGGEGGEGGSGGEEFKPESLSKEAQEYIRKTVQSESDSKTALVEKRLRDEQATRARSAVEDAEQLELRQLAESGQHEALGQRMALRLTQRSVEEKAIAGASNLIEQQMADKFSESLGPERVEQIRREVIKEGGAHAEFAAGLAKAAGGESRKEEIAAEVKAQMLEAGVKVRDADPGPGQVAGAGQGQSPSGFDKVEQDYIDGKLGPTPTLNRKAYEKALEARTGE